MGPPPLQSLRTKTGIQRPSGRGERERERERERPAAYPRSAFLDGVEAVDILRDQVAQSVIRRTGRAETVGALLTYRR